MLFGRNWNQTDCVTLPPLRIKCIHEHMACGNEQPGCRNEEPRAKQMDVPLAVISNNRENPVTGFCRNTITRPNLVPTR
jgi:hypothetical protein